MRDQRGFDGWFNLVTSVILPTGVLTAFLFYFGYASSRAEYEYFGIDVDTVGMDTQEFLMRRPPPAPHTGGVTNPGGNTGFVVSYQTAYVDSRTGFYH